MIVPHLTYDRCLAVAYRALIAFPCSFHVSSLVSVYNNVSSASGRSRRTARAPIRGVGFCWFVGDHIQSQRAIPYADALRQLSVLTFCGPQWTLTVVSR